MELLKPVFSLFASPKEEDLRCKIKLGEAIFIDRKLALHRQRLDDFVI